MIDALVERVTVAAYGDHEQQSAFWQWFEDEARFPFRAVVVGAEVDVVGVGGRGIRPRSIGVSRATSSLRCGRR